MNKVMVTILAVMLLTLVLAGPALAQNKGANREELVQRLIAADTNKDQRVSWEEAQAAFPKITRERFDQHDKNHDGFLSREDRPQGVGNGNDRTSRGEIISRLQKADTNNDQRVNWEEAQAAFPQATRERFDRFDRNNDGVISMDDKPQGAGNGQGQMVQRLIAADTNKDQRVSWEEAQAAFPKVTRERFSQLDRNQDGYLSKDDRRNGNSAG